MRSRILIIGVNGYLGGNLVRHFLSPGQSHEVFGIDRRRRRELPDSVLFFKNDLSSIKTLRTIVRRVRPDKIYYLAAKLYSTDVRHLLNDNVIAALNVFEALQSTAMERTKVILVSSAAEYGLVPPKELPVVEETSDQPSTFYGLTKSWQTSLGQFYARLGLKVTVARIFNILGPGMSDRLALGNVMKQIHEIKGCRCDPVIHVGNINAKRDFLFVDDVVEALVALSEDGRSGEMYNVCSGKSWSIEYLIRKMLQLSGVDARILVEARRSNKKEVLNIYGSNKKIKQDTGWHPRTDILTALKIIAKNR